MNFSTRLSLLLFVTAPPILAAPYLSFDQYLYRNDPLRELRDFGDLLRTLDHGPEVDRLLNDPALSAVTKEFGASVISTTTLPRNSPVAEAKIKPWSSWWYPKREDYLFSDSAANGNSAALNKYDYIRQRRAGRSGSAASFERNAYSPKSLSWEGLCDAWALASITHSEPRRSVTFSASGATRTFNVSDLKALLLKTYEAVDDSALKYYGQKFTGDENGWIYPDIFPEQFHRFLEVQLFEKKEPFIMDHDPGIEVWNVPVYKANYTVAAVADNPNAVFVRAWLYSAESVDTNNRQFVGTREAVREYDYVLVGTRNPAGDLVIDSGYWIKGPDGVDSRKSHPDYLIRIPDATRIVRRSWNPEIDITLIDEILSTAN